MLKLFVVLALVGMMFAFTGCDKPKAETEKAAVAEQVYAQDVQAGAKEAKEAVKEAPVKQEAAKPAEAKAEQPKKTEKAEPKQKKETKAVEGEKAAKAEQGKEVKAEPAK